MSLLKEIQEAAVNSSTDIGELLRKCRVLASRLDHAELKAWVQNELNGYDADATLPDYRLLKCQSKGHFVGFGGMQLNNATIPTQNIPEEVRDAIRTARIRQSVISLQDLVRIGNRDSFGTPWPTEAIEAFGSEFYEDMNLLEAHQVIPRSGMIGIVETVRNRVLNFALEIEAANPDAGEAPVGTKPVPERTVNQIFNNYITGNVGNIASGSSHVQQMTHMHIEPGNISALRTALASLGISKAETARLETAIKSDPPLKPGATFGKKVSAWMGAMLGKSAQGLLKVSTEVAAGTLSAAIKSYCGLP